MTEALADGALCRRLTTDCLVSNVRGWSGRLMQMCCVRLSRVHTASTASRVSLSRPLQQLVAFAIRIAAENDDSNHYVTNWGSIALVSL